MHNKVFTIFNITTARIQKNMDYLVYTHAYERSDLHNT